ncbi:MAG: Myo-inositol 2-dehydrogenase [uncultured Thermomicrobiales bacterium]|uniref:Myo-inositol 2-dehydrogenase n=1 Tax=uncultured Thermomicrobiales bacterium TaxID=1645740 RepID=A0A6J4VMK7_9BACT|nr:MAG: Myo-inositol 2-dehydrogenase [uncultured Thermomicrobiales bacterium]
MGDRVRVGLIGAGRIGGRHARALASQVPGAELVAVADANFAAARAAADEHRIGRATSDPAALIADPTVEAVVIASSTASHAPLIAAAAAAGKDVFCEKPIALDLVATDAALDAVAAAGIRLQIGFQRRFDAGYRRAREMVVAGALGRIEWIRDTMRDPAPPPRDYVATSGGLYRDMTAHNFDCVRWLLGEEVEELFAMGAALVDPMFGELGDVDTSVVSLRFAGGAIGAIDNGRRSGFGYDVRTEIFGSEGALLVGYARGTPLLHFSRDGVRSDHVEGFLDRFADAYVEELRAFVVGVATGSPTTPDGADARAALALAYAAETSLRERRPVSPACFGRGAAAGHPA